MKPILLTATIFALTAAALLAAEPDAEQAPEDLADRPTDRLLEGYYHAPADGDAGTLYKDTARLRKLLLLMPDRIERPRLPEDPAELEPVADPDVAVDTPVLTAETPAQQQPTWQTAVDGPVVARGRLAWTCYQAGRYEDAAAIYRAMLDEDADHNHARFMLFLCLRNMGELAAARKLHNELPKDSKAREWAGWTVEMDDMAGVAAEEGEGAVEESNEAQTNATPGEESEDANGT
jgi:tetratricopeptide (TPR) repeat protein